MSIMDMISALQGRGREQVRPRPVRRVAKGFFFFLEMTSGCAMAPWRPGLMVTGAFATDVGG